jgi:5-methylcytosine-specific restriction enzyme subunit McrC
MAGAITVQVLTKVARPSLPRSSKETHATRNLLYLLGYTRAMEAPEVGLASLAIQPAGLLEILPVVRGRLLLARQVRATPATRHLLHVGYDEFTADCPLNRLFLFVTRLLLRETRLPENSRRLLLLRALLADVGHEQFDAASAARIQLTRLNQRFEPVLNFCQLLLRERMPGPDAGGGACFSFLFDMNVLFERFIGEFIRRNLAAEFPGIRLQGPKRYLVSRKTGTGGAQDGGPCFGMIPDVHLTPADPARAPLVLDTKYKRLDPAAGVSEGVSQADLYQMYAYGRKYGCPAVILLYPQAPGATKCDVCFEFEAGARVFVRTVDLCRDLALERDQLREELRACLATGSAPGA